MEEAVKCLSSGKAPGADSIPVEIYTSGGPQLNRKLTELFQSMWNQEKVPQELKDASIVHLYKHKRNRQDGRQPLLHRPAIRRRGDSSQDTAEPT